MVSADTALCAYGDVRQPASGQAGASLTSVSRPEKNRTFRRANASGIRIRGSCRIGANGDDMNLLKWMAALWFAAAVSPVTACAQTAWTTSWAASPVAPIGQDTAQRTVRQYVRLSAGGTQVRIRFSNESGSAPLVIGAARIARPGRTAGSIDPASSRPLTFDGQSGVVVAAGAPILSDPVDLALPPLSTLAVSLFVRACGGASVVHPDGGQAAYLASGEQTAQAALTAATTSTQRFFLSAVEVANPVPLPALVTFGDSITDGYLSTVDANRRWPDRLAERLVAHGHPIGVVNAGIGGNQLLHDHPGDEYGANALARFDRDVLAHSGIRWLVVMEGINDIGLSGRGGNGDRPVTAAQLIAAHKQLIARAKARGLKVYGATLTPFEGTTYPGYFTARGEATRQAVNAWIRSSGAYDAVIDADAALRDPRHPARLRPDYDAGDHLHPNDAGYEAMADAVELGLFQ
jgi:lysophospholipase L1-like esterase